MSKFLDKEGLKILWDNIKQYIDEKLSNIGGAV